MISKEMISKNKERFIEIVRSINRKNADIEGFIDKLNKSDFFYAPASTKYHNAYEGGLCEHSLEVYDNLKMISHSLVKGNGDDMYDTDTIKIVGLFHDIYKMNFYEEYIRNEKVYSENGKKYDEMGKYDWKSVKAYKIREVDDRFIYGSNEQNADFIVSYFFPLSVEEHAAILNSSGGQNYNCSNLDVTPIYSKYPLVVLLHTADLLATYIPTRHKEEEEHIEEEKIECPPEHTSVEKPWVMDSEDM